MSNPDTQEVAILEPFLAPLGNLAQALQGDNRDRAERALNQIHSVVDFYREELKWRAHNPPPGASQGLDQAEVDDEA